MVRRRIASEKLGWTNGLRQCIRSLVESRTLDHDGFRPLSSFVATRPSKDLFRYQVWKAPVRPLCHLSNPPADLAGSGSFRSEFRGLWPTSEPDTSRFCTRPPRPCESACSPTPRPPHFGGYEPAVAIANRSVQAPVWSDIGSRLVLL